MDPIPVKGCVGGFMSSKNGKERMSVELHERKE